MSLPSLKAVIDELDFNPAKMGSKDQERALVEAMRRDLPEAVLFLEEKAREAARLGKPIDWLEDPNSTLGKQLIRIHASDALRPLASKHFCEGKRLTFVNCCGGKLGGPPPSPRDLFDLQIKMQAGPISYANC